MANKLAIAIAAFLYFGISVAAYGDTKMARRARDIEIDRQVIESSPVLRRWLENPPNLLDDIYNVPSFDKKLKLGITSRNNSLGIEAGFEDLFVGQSPLTVNGSYQTEFSGRESELQANFRYYLLPRFLLECRAHSWLSSVQST